MPTRFGAGLLACLAAAGACRAAAAQESSFCGGTDAGPAARCAAVAQAAYSGHAQVGMLLAGGDPFPEPPPAAGAPRGARYAVGLRAIHFRAPDLSSRRFGEPEGPLRTAESVVQPALDATVAVPVRSGRNGFGSVEVLGTADVLLTRLIGRDIFERGGVFGLLGLGGGVRVGLMEESARRPGVAASLVYRRVGRQQMGNVCEGPERSMQGHAADPPNAARRSCREPVAAADGGEASYGVSALAARAVLTRSVAGARLATGVGYDRFRATDASVSTRFGLIGGSGTIVILRYSGLRLESDRFSAFVNGVVPVEGGALVVELGWMGGGDALPGYPATASYDPGTGTLFGGISARVPL